MAFGAGILSGCDPEGSISASCIRGGGESDDWSDSRSGVLVGDTITGKGLEDVGRSVGGFGDWWGFSWVLSIHDR